MKAIERLGGLLLLALVSACGQGKTTGDAAAGSKAATVKPIDGFNDFRLGAKFEDILGNIDPSWFYPGSVSECMRDLPVKGCRIYGRPEAVYVIRDAIPYFPGLTFNRLGALTDTDLEYRREGGITGAECRDIFGRTLDWLSADYGPFVMRKEGGPGNTDVWTKSPKGTSYSYLKPSSEGSFVTGFMRWKATRIESRNAGGEKSDYRANRSASLFGSYIVVDTKPHCSINVMFAEPDSVERPAWPDEATGTAEAPVTATKAGPKPIPDDVDIEAPSENVSDRGE